MSYSASGLPNPPFAFEPNVHPKMASVSGWASCWNEADAFGDDSAKYVVVKFHGVALSQSSKMTMPPFLLGRTIEAHPSTAPIPPAEGEDVKASWPDVAFHDHLPPTEVQFVMYSNGLDCGGTGGMLALAAAVAAMNAATVRTIFLDESCVTDSLVPYRVQC